MWNASRLIACLGVGLGVCGWGVLALGQQGADEAAVSLTSGSGGVNGVESADAETAPPRIQIAILLDTSGSMGGLIDQARTELWALVNQFALARRNGLAPRIEVALYQYGSSQIPSEDGYIRQHLPLTEDLDRVSEVLHSFAAGGGSEHCPQAVQHAVDHLQWAGGDVYKAIFIAGNERFQQGPVDARTACEAAIKRGIIVNPIYCGSRSGAESWQQAAAWADGAFSSIDHNRRVMRIETPYDDEIAQLSSELNETYVAMGAAGAEARARQVAQDAQAAGAGQAVEAERAVAKTNANYEHGAARWDLVAAVEQKQVKLEDVPEADLPEPMRAMSMEAREAYVAEQAARRDAIRSRIQSLNASRVSYIEEQRRVAENAAGGPADLGSSIQAVFGKQIARNNMTIESPITQPADTAAPTTQPARDSGGANAPGEDSR